MKLICKQSAKYKRMLELLNKTVKNCGKIRSNLQLLQAGRRVTQL